jgi:uncharacterized membrane protein
MSWLSDPWTLAAIAAMTVATLACRAGGYLVFRSITPSPLVRDVLAFIPGTLFMAYVAPALVHGGPAHWGAAAATAAAMIGTRSIPLALGAGIATAWGISLL